MITSKSQLREVYGFPKGRAKDKVLVSLEKHSIHFIENSPFLVLSTVDLDGKLDASPRGGEPGFVRISNNKELLIPDYKGNNRVDSLSNIVVSGRLGMLFMIPGIDETLRVNGRATLTTSEDILNQFSSLGKPPISCIMVTIDEVFLHCAKAFMRSQLWKTTSYKDPNDFPSMGEMLTDQLRSSCEPETREAMKVRYLKDI
jgi:PPOX class probable FMN-dependent enzyme